jgi:hypothetical protein
VKLYTVDMLSDRGVLECEVTETPKTYRVDTSKWQWGFGRVAQKSAVDTDAHAQYEAPIATSRERAIELFRAMGEREIRLLEGKIANIRARMEAVK